MKSRTLVLLALVSLGLAGCGAAAAPTGHAAAPATVAATPASDPPTPSMPHHRRHRAKTKPGHATSPSAGVTSNSKLAKPKAPSSGASAPATEVAKAKKRHSTRQTRNTHTPHSCLKFAGLGHIRALGQDRWQGTTGENIPSEIKDSVFVTGPYPSVGAARTAASIDRNTEIAFPGGLYVATAINQSYLSATVSLAAACLSANGRSFTF